MTIPSKNFLQHFVTLYNLVKSHYKFDICVDGYTLIALYAGYQDPRLYERSTSNKKITVKPKRKNFNDRQTLIDEVLLALIYNQRMGNIKTFPPHYNQLRNFDSANRYERYPTTKFYADYSKYYKLEDTQDKSQYSSDTLRSILQEKEEIYTIRESLIQTKGRTNLLSERVEVYPVDFQDYIELQESKVFKIISEYLDDKQSKDQKNYRDRFRIRSNNLTITTSLVLLKNVLDHRESTDEKIPLFLDFNNKYREIIKSCGLEDSFRIKINGQYATKFNVFQPPSFFLVNYILRRFIEQQSNQQKDSFAQIEKEFRIKQTDSEKHRLKNKELNDRLSELLKESLNKILIEDFEPGAIPDWDKLVRSSSEKLLDIYNLIKIQQLVQKDVEENLKALQKDMQRGSICIKKDNNYYWVGNFFLDRFALPTRPQGIEEETENQTNIRETIKRRVNNFLVELKSEKDITARTSELARRIVNGIPVGNDQTIKNKQEENKYDFTYAIVMLWVLECYSQIDLVFTKNLKITLTDEDSKELVKKYRYYSHAILHAAALAKMIREEKASRVSVLLKKIERVINCIVNSKHPYNDQQKNAPYHNYKTGLGISYVYFQVVEQFYEGHKHKNDQLFLSLHRDGFTEPLVSEDSPVYKYLHSALAIIDKVLTWLGANEDTTTRKTFKYSLMNAKMYYTCMALPNNAINEKIDNLAMELTKIQEQEWQAGKRLNKRGDYFHYLCDTLAIYHVRKATILKENTLVGKEKIIERIKLAQVYNQNSLNCSFRSVYVNMYSDFSKKIDNWLTELQEQ